MGWPGGSFYHSTNVSFITSFTLSTSLSVKVSKRFTILRLSIVLIWSNAIQPLVCLCFISTRVGYGLELLVIGATTIVCKNLFISLGDKTTQGLVFFISLPIVGSRLTNTMSYWFICSILQNFRPQKHHSLKVDHPHSCASS